MICLLIGGGWSAGNGEVDFSATTPNTDKLITVAVAPGADQLGYGINYEWRLRVFDSQGGDSGWANGPDFTTPSHMYPTVDFSFLPTNPTKDEIIAFTDASECYNASNNPYQCQVQDGTGIDYAWDFTPGIPDSHNRSDNASTTYDAFGVYNVVLEITDTTLAPAAVCTDTQQVRVGPHLPDWQEVAPQTRSRRISPRPGLCL